MFQGRYKAIPIEGEEPDYFRIASDYSVVGDEWICRRLELGSRMNVHRAVTRYRAAADKESRKWKKLLLCAD